MEANLHAGITWQHTDKRTHIEKLRNMHPRDAPVRKISCNLYAKGREILFKASTLSWGGVAKYHRAHFDKKKTKPKPTFRSPAPQAYGKAPQCSKYSNHKCLLCKLCAIDYDKTQAIPEL